MAIGSDGRDSEAVAELEGVEALEGVEEPEAVAHAGSSFADAFFETALGRLLLSIWELAKKLAGAFRFGDGIADIALNVRAYFEAVLRAKHEKGDDVLFDAMRSANDLSRWVRPVVYKRGLKWREREHRAAQRDGRYGRLHLDRGNRFASPLSDAEASEIRRIREATLAALSPEHQRVVAFKIDLDLTLEEVAAALGIPVIRVRRRLREAKRALVKALAEYRNWAPDRETGLEEDLEDLEQIEDIDP